MKKRKIYDDGCAAQHEAGNTAFAVLFAISLAHLLNDMIQSVVPAIYPMLKDNYALTFGQIGMITLVYQMTSSVLQPFVGLYADRHPRPYSLAFGMCLTLAGLLTLAFSASYALVLLAVGIIGCGSSVFHPESSRVAQMASGGRKSLAQSIFQVGGNGGSAIGPLLAAVVVIPHGQGAVGWFAVAAFAAFAVLTGIGRWYSRILEQRMKDGSGVVTVTAPYQPAVVRKAMTILVIMIFSKYFFISSMTSYFTFFLMDKFGVSVQQSQMCLFAFLAALAVGTLAGGFLGDRYGRKYVILFSIFGAAPFALALPYLDFGLTVVFSVVTGLVIASAFSAILVYATDLKPEKVGMVSGVFFGLMFGLGGIASAFFGWLADRTSVEFIFHVSTLLPLLGIIAAWLPDTGRK
ncbi:MAG: MFS transporter [Bacteroidales bacterium]|nr:MFS transporter [Bacteroidales bacterium]